MKFAVVVLVLLPMALAMTVEERGLLDSLTGGVDILATAKQLAAQFGTDETEAQCESTMCPPLIDHITHNALIKSIACVAICKEAQVLAQQIH